MLNKLFKFVRETCNQFSIDESHGLTHSIQVYRFGLQIYNEVLKSNPKIKSRFQVIICSCILHDMCDYKYIDEIVGVERISKLLQDLGLDKAEINLICKIITTMSYTKIKVNGFPKFDNSIDELAFHIVREADLLAAYDFDRSVVYAMECKGSTWIEANKETVEYFKIRVLTQIIDGLFTIPISLELACKLHELAQSNLD
jgi:HD superfamily phosphodiesterase